MGDKYTIIEITDKGMEIIFVNVTKEFICNYLSMHNNNIVIFKTVPISEFK